MRDDVQLEAIACELATSVAGVLQRRERAARTVTIKLRYADFSTITRGQTVRAATDDEGFIRQAACALLRRALQERAGPLRLMGVGVSGLSAERQLTLF